MTRDDESHVVEGLVRLADRCSEALAALHADEEVDHNHVENLNDINREVWRMRWRIGLFGGSTEIEPPALETPALASEVKS